MQELVEFRYHVARGSFVFRLNGVGELSDKYMDWLIAVLDAYRGPDREENHHNTLKILRKQTPEARKISASIPSEPGGLNIPVLSLPLFISHTSELAICPARFQFLTLKVRLHVDLYNHSVARAEHWQDKTFNELPELRGSAVHHNLRAAYDAARRQTDIIVRLIEDLKKEYRVCKGLVRF